MMQNSYVRTLLAALFFMQALFASPAFAIALKAGSLVTPPPATSLLGATQAMHVPADVAQKTALAKAVEELSLGPTAALPKGHPMYGGLGAPIVNKAGETVSNILIPKGKKANAIRMLRTAGKFALIDFPIEAFAFFLALGALNYTQLYFDFAENPISMEQHLHAHDARTAEGRIGFVSFFAFMGANRVTDHMLRTHLKPNSKLRAFVPYMGMSVGFMASNIVHEIHNFGELKKCVRALRERIEEEEKYATCERAYDNWSEVGLEKMQQYAPTLMAMVTSTITSGIVESLTIKKVIMATSWKFIYEAATIGTPLGWGARTIKFTYHVASLMWFTKFQMLQEPGLTQWFKNWQDGGELASSLNTIMAELHLKKRNGWKPLSEAERGAEHDLDMEIHKFSQRSKEWRKGNMMDVLNSHGAWLGFLTNFSTTYKAAMEFDSFFMAEYNKKFQEKKPSLLDAPFYLAGVKAEKPEDDSIKLDLLNNTSDYEDRQLGHLIKVRAYYEKWLAEQSPADQKTYAKFYAEIREILEHLPTQEEFQRVDGKKIDMPRIAKGLDILNKKLHLKNQYPGIFNRSLKPPPAIIIENETLLNLRSEIGEPWPLYQPGEGFLSAYGQDDAKAKTLGMIKVPKQWERLRLPKPSHYLFSQILKGPRADLNQAVIEESDGFPATFLPPRLVDSYKYQVMDAAVRGQKGTLPTIFNSPVIVKGAKPQSFNTAFDIVRGPNLLKSVLEEKEGFMAWWNKHVETQYIKAWDKYENEYQRIMVKLIERYQFDAKEEWSWSNWWSRLKRSGANVGPMSNGLRQSMLQERRMYLLILGEVVRDHAQLFSANHGILKQGFKDEAIDASKYPVLPTTMADMRRRNQIKCNAERISVQPLEQQMTEKTECGREQLNQVGNLQLLKILMDSQNFNLSGILAAYNNKLLKPYGSENVGTHFEFQDQISAAFEEMEALINQMKITEVVGGKGSYISNGGVQEFDLTKKIVQSTITNKQLSAAQENIENVLEEIDEQLKETLEPANRHAFQIVQACVIGLNKLAQQQVDLGKVVNTVSYTRSEDRENPSAQPSVCSSTSLFTSQKGVTGQTYKRKGCDVSADAGTGNEEESFD
ncbi:MAG: hypothetical protein ACXWC9_02130 [Pseudobdellovibrionaceae bacterium]